MTELVDMRADAIGPGTEICISGATVLVTAVDAHDRVVDLHTEYGPALRFLRTDWVAAAIEAEMLGAA